MTDVMVAVMLTLGVASVLLSCAGLLVMRTPLDRLHFTAPAGTIGPVLSRPPCSWRSRCRRPGSRQ